VLDRKTVDQRMESIDLVGPIVIGMEGARLREDVEGAFADPADPVVQASSAAGETLVREGEHPELHLRQDLCRAFLVEGEDLGQDVEGESSAGGTQPVESRRDAFLDEGEAPLAQRVLGREQSTKGGGCDAGLVGDVPHGQSGQAVTREYP
jgi:hypothetical protein